MMLSRLVDPDPERSGIGDEDADFVASGLSDTQPKDRRIDDDPASSRANQSASAVVSMASAHRHDVPFPTTSGVLPMMTKDQPVWLITGCSTGFGRELTTLVLERGWSAVVTARNVAQVESFATQYGDRALVRALDVTLPEQIDRVVRDAQQHFGRIDVLVNNAGYGYLAAIEEGEDEAVRAMFETNVFGLIAARQGRARTRAEEGRAPDRRLRCVGEDDLGGGFPRLIERRRSSGPALQFLVEG